MSAVYAWALPETTSITVMTVHIGFHEQPAVDDP